MKTEQTHLKEVNKVLLDALRAFAFDYSPRPQDIAKYRITARAAIAKAEGGKT